MTVFRSSPGTGQLFLSSSSETAPAQFTHLSGTYPLKLLAPTPLPSQPSNLRVCYMLAYGGGLVAGDAISLHVRVGNGSRLLLLTQGSTKVFKNRTGLRPSLAKGDDDGSYPRGGGGTSTSEITRQRLLVHLEPGSLLLLLPDPIQPFKSSSYIQSQRFVFPAPSSSPSDHTDTAPANALILDWYTSGRNITQSSTSKYQEEWEFDVYSSMNEIVYAPPTDIPPVQPSNEHLAHVNGNKTHLSPAPTTPSTTIPFMHEKVTLINSPPSTSTSTDTSRTITDISLGTALQTRMRPYQTYATLLVHGPLLEPLTNHLAKLANSQRERQFQGNKPDGLVWSFSMIAPPREGVHFFPRAGPGILDENSGGGGGGGGGGVSIGGGTGILRVAGTETERVKLWIEEALVAGRVRELVGDALWQRVF
ncbi:hypothetical protein QFC24_003817 [Naganishia onofrii]|uniref:Uncharacterized protein n=1 Tax=Naganishia onofrii TaxID=1851511 RepID=A0ACC2XJN4_9TREE|nr:hypothetical protein QFC24_003817 [Naganishia onofrii]